ncbi:UDP-N-acetylglucosamine acyltransferase [Maricaulis sp.]|uniref:UDP-N-acetylglucosamine acyltransferase n=1 Tax=Maricaulis sp. TaxID=1486257 RepID=UPI003A94A726
MNRLLLVCLIALSAAACSTVPPLNFTPADINVVARQQPVALVSVIVTIARPDEAAGQIEIAGMENDVQQLWISSLEDAVTRMAIFNDNASTRVNMNVKILKLDIPAAGLAMTTQTIARYELLDRNTGAVVFTSDVQADGRVPMDFAFVGVIRARESVSRSVQNNIATFLQQLEAADLSEAQFPSPRDAN